MEFPDHKIYRMLNYPALYQENAHSIVIESVDYHEADEETGIKIYNIIIYVISVQKDCAVSVGREGCDVEICDEFTSRHHASIVSCGDNVFLFDEKSRFGTHILEKSAVKIENG